MEANRKETTDFDVTFNGEEWHIYDTWIQVSGEIAWYSGATSRGGVLFHRTFTPNEIEVPRIEKGD